MSDPGLRRLHVSPYLLLGLAALFWAGNFVVGRAVGGRVPPVALSFWRWAVALALILPFAWPSLRAQAPALRRAWPVLVPLGILGVGNFNTMVYLGLRQTTATNAVLLNSACPALIVAISFAAGGGRPAARQLLGIAVSLAGVLAIASRGRPASLLALAFNPGDLWVMGAVASWALYTVLLRRRPAGVDGVALLTALMAVGLAWIAPFYAWELARGERLVLDAVTLGAIAYVGLLPSVAAYVFWNRAVAEIGPSRAGVFMHLLPAFGAALAVVALGESFRAFHLAGIGLILAGVALAAAAAPRLARQT